MDKKKIGILMVAVVLTIGGVSGLTILEKKALNPSGTTQVVIAKKDVKKSEVITEKNISKFFEEVQQDSRYVPKNAVTSLEDVKKMITGRDIEAKSQLNSNDLIDEKSHLANFNEPVIVGFKVNDSSRLLAGKIRKGDIIDIYEIGGATGEEGKTNNIVYENAYVLQAFGSDNMEITSSDEGTATMLNIVIEKDMLDSYNKMIENDTIRISKKL